MASHKRRGSKLGGRISPPRAGRGVSWALLVLVVVPLIASVWSAWLLVSNSRTEARHAAHIESGVPIVDGLLQTAQALRIEGTAAGVAAYTRDLDPATTKLIESFSGSGDLGSSRAKVDRAVAASAASLPAFTARLRGDIDVIRRDAARPTATEQAVGADYLRVVDELVDEFTRRSDVLISEAQQLKHGADIVAVLTALNSAGIALHYRTSTFSDVAAVFVTPGAVPAATIAQLARDDGLYQVQSALLTNSPATQVAKRWREYVADPRVHEFNAIVAAYLSGEYTPAADQYLHQVRVITTAVGFIDSTFGSVLQEIDQTLAQNAQAIRASSAATERETTVALSVVVILVAGLAIFVSRWIGDPLRDLSASARAVTDGRLDGSATPAKGPREIRQVATAFNELVGNLRLLEAKTLAVADLRAGQRGRR